MYVLILLQEITDFLNAGVEKGVSVPVSLANGVWQTVGKRARGERLL